MSGQSTLLTNLTTNYTNDVPFLLNIDSTTNWPNNLIDEFPPKSSDSTIEYFKTNKNIFKVIIHKDNGMYTLKIGGDNYNDCINISIKTTEQGEPTQVKIGHIQSELECGVRSVMSDTVHFVSAALQYCVQRFPGIKQFEFDDMSRIDCGTTKNKNAPRHMEKPFSLAHFSLAKYGQTWYEQKFGAKMVNSQLYTIYRNNVQKLFQPIGLSFNEFTQFTFMTSNQEHELKPYFSPLQTWVEFFTSIPKTKHCTVLFNWLETFIENLLEGSYNPKSWCIPIENIPTISIQLNIQPNQYGGGRKTRRNRRYKSRFITSWSNVMNFHSV